MDRRGTFEGGGLKKSVFLGGRGGSYSGDGFWEKSPGKRPPADLWNSLWKGLPPTAFGGPQPTTWEMGRKKALGAAPRAAPAWPAFSQCRSNFIVVSALAGAVSASRNLVRDFGDPGGRFGPDVLPG